MGSSVGPEVDLEGSLVGDNGGSSNGIGELGAGVKSDSGTSVGKLVGGGDSDDVGSFEGGSAW